MKSKIRSVALAVVASGIVIPAVPLALAATPPRIEHVLLLSIDGFHEVDLANCIAAETCPSLAALARHGEIYTDAYTTRPSDSFPGTIAEVTGATPRVSGVYYDDTFDRSLFPPSSNCEGLPGSEVRLTGHLDRDSTRLDGGAATGLSGNSAAAINPARLPEVRVHGRCRPLWPHDYIRVNTVFGVLHASGLRTAWIDKHPAYEILNGPGAPHGGPGDSIDDFFAPEIDALLTAENLGKTAAPSRDVGGLSNAHESFADSVWAVQLYDGLKVRAILNEIAGHDHTGRHQVGTPALFGMNFQSVNVAQKRSPGGYRDTQATPSAALRGAIEEVDRSIGRMMMQLRRRGLASSTLVIVTAKHGNAPIDRSRLKIVSDADVLTPALDAHGHLDRFHVADDVLLEWLMPGHHSDVRRVIEGLIARQSAGIDLGIGKFYSGNELRALFGDPRTDPRVPDFILSPRLGVIYTGHAGKLAEHGGFHEDDRHVALLVSNPALASGTFGGRVETTQIAPTILEALGLDAQRLDAVRREGTAALPGLPLAVRR